MLHKSLLSPRSIAVIGGSDDVRKPGGKLLSNLKSGLFKGEIVVVNYKKTEVQGLSCYKRTEDLPQVDLAFLCIPAASCIETVEILAKKKNTRAFVIISAGFSEEGESGAVMERRLKEIVDEVGGTLIGPNCIGLICPEYSGVFTLPIPIIDPHGCDLISSSGATAVFIFESAMPKGLAFSSVYSIGNCAQTNAEDILQHLDECYIHGQSSPVKLLYLEAIRDPDKLLKHASSLIRKGCRIAAIKAGTSEAGSRAAMSHTGALANSDMAVEALFRKAGIVRCHGREELTTVASIFLHQELKGKRIAIVTHAGGPAVMLTDALSGGGLEIPAIEGKFADELLKSLPQGSSVKNPIDILATGTARQLEKVIEYCDVHFENIDAIIVIFGSTGLTKVYEAYDVLHTKMQTCKKPIFPILPSILTAQKEVDCFLSKGHVHFPDEVQLGRAITKVYNTPLPAAEDNISDKVDINGARKIIEKSTNGFLNFDDVKGILGAAQIPLVMGVEVSSREELIENAYNLGYPLVAKVVGPVHKSDVGGVSLNLKSDSHLLAEYERMMRIEGATAVLLQPMLKGAELFIGAKYEPHFGHILMCGLGGIFVEVLGDLSYGLAPLSESEAYSMIHSLKAYPIIKGTRGQKGLPEDQLAQIIVRLSSLLRFSTEIVELDLNPLIATENNITVVDARIRIEKPK